METRRKRIHQLDREGIWISGGMPCLEKVTVPTLFWHSDVVNIDSSLQTPCPSKYEEDLTRSAWVSGQRTVTSGWR